MATYRCNPNSPTDGTGSVANPYNTWTGKTFASGDVLLQDSGTTFTGRLNIGAGVTNISIGMYGSGDRPKINCWTQDRCIQVFSGANNGILEDFEFFGSSGIRLVAIGESSSLPAHGWRVENCFLHDNNLKHSSDSNALQIFGNDSVANNNIIMNIATDQIWMQGARVTVTNNILLYPGLDGKNNGDNIQLYGDSTLPGGAAYVAYNYCNHLNGSYKQCIIYQDVSGASGGTIEQNICLMALYYENTQPTSNALFIDVPNTKVRGNYVTGGLYGIYFNANNGQAYSNVVDGPRYGITQGSTVTGLSARNNTILNCMLSGLYADQDTSFTAYNNIVANCKDAISMEGGATEDYNCLWNNQRNVVSLGGAASQGANTTTNINPKLNFYYTPQNQTIKQSGTALPIGNGGDKNKKPFLIPPSRGAMEMFNYFPTVTSSREIFG